MDSRQLYVVAQQLSSTLNWEKEWVHFGTEKEIKFYLIQDIIMDFLNSENLNFVCERTNSGIIKKKDALTKIKELLGVKDFQLWNQQMDRSIQFKSMGVLLKGKS